MMKTLIPQALAILVCIANTHSTFAMDPALNYHFQRALDSLEELGTAQTEETNLKSKIAKKTTNFETLKDRTEADLRKVLQISSDDAKNWAYEIATKLDERSAEAKQNLLMIEHYKSRQAEVPKCYFEKPTYNIGRLKDLEKKVEEDKIRRAAESKKMFEMPSQFPFLTFEGTIYVGIGQHLFFHVMGMRYTSKKACLDGMEITKKYSEEGLRYFKAQFIERYSIILGHAESARKIREVAEMMEINLPGECSMKSVNLLGERPIKSVNLQQRSKNGVKYTRHK